MKSYVRVIVDCDSNLPYKPCRATRSIFICYDQSFSACKAVLPVRTGIYLDFNGVSENLLDSMSVD